MINEFDKYLLDKYKNVINYIDISAKQLADYIANLSYNKLQELNTNLEIITPNKEDISHKINVAIKNYYTDIFNGILSFIIKEDKTINNNDINSLITETILNKELLLMDKCNNEEFATKIIDQVITHINFKNMNNQKYCNIENKVESTMIDSLEQIIDSNEKSIKEKVNEEKITISQITDSLISSLTKDKTQNNITKN